MSAPAIPAGYRRLRVGEIIKRGDKISSPVGGPWLSCVVTVGARVYESRYVTFIRRIAPVRRRKGGKKGKHHG